MYITCICEYVCMYVCMYVYIYIYTSIEREKRWCVRVCVCVCGCVCVCVCICIGIYIYTYIYIYICMCIYIYIYIYIHTLMYVYDRLRGQFFVTQKLAATCVPNPFCPRSRTTLEVVVLGALGCSFNKQCLKSKDNP